MRTLNKDHTVETEKEKRTTGTTLTQ